MPKLVLLRGISGSGKSTWAKEQTQNGQYFRVNRDNIRPMIADTKWSQDKEKIVIACERAMASAILQRNKHVIVDDTNLTDHHLNSWKQLAQNEGAQFEVKEIKTPLAECIQRDSLRIGTERVGQAVIERQAIKSGIYNISCEPNSIVFCDIDGTIARGDHRVGILADKSDRNRWVKYFDLCDKDEPIWTIIDKLHKFRNEGKKIVLVSGRAADLTFDKTLRWLKDYSVPFDRILMRLGSDGRSDVEVKQEILNEFLSDHPKNSIFLTIDDRPAVCDKVWRKNELPLMQVHNGKEVPGHKEHLETCKSKDEPIKGICRYCLAVEDF